MVAEFTFEIEALNYIASRLASINDICYVLAWFCFLVVALFIVRFLYYSIFKSIFNQVFKFRI